VTGRDQARKAGGGNTEEKGTTALTGGKKPWLKGRKGTIVEKKRKKTT